MAHWQLSSTTSTSTKSTQIPGEKSQAQIRLSQDQVMLCAKDGMRVASIYSAESSQVQSKAPFITTTTSGDWSRARGSGRSWKGKVDRQRGVDIE